MIYPETGWFKIVQYNEKEAYTIEKLVEQTWLCVYPRPAIITYDRLNKFLGYAFKNYLIEREYGIKAKCATTENPQDNSTLERISQINPNLVCTFDLQNNYQDEDDPWSGILSATDFVVQIMYHTTIQSTPGKMVFGRDMILNTPFIAEYEYIRLHRQKIIDKNNQIEKKRKLHTYRIREKVLVHYKKSNIYEELYIGPYSINQVRTNGTFTIRRGVVQEHINIIWIKPYHK